MPTLMLDHLINLLLALATMLGFWGSGRTVRRLFIKLDDTALLAVADFGIGSWLVWTTLFLLGLLGGYQNWVARLLLGIIFLVGALQFSQVFNRLRGALSWPEDRYSQILSIITLVLIFIAMLGALTPPAAQDALVHHLALPKTLIKAGRQLELPYDYFSYFPAGMEMLYLFGLLVHNAGLATLLHLGFGIALFAALLAGGQTLGLSQRASLIAGVAFLTIPTVWMEMTWAYVDLTISFYITLAVLTLVNFRQQLKSDRPRFDWIWLTGFSLGAALSIKYTALFVIVIMTLLILIVLRETKHENFKMIWHALIVPMLIALLVSLPWFVRNIIYTGNPLFPFLLNIIPSHNPGWDVDRAKIVLMVLNRYGGENKIWLDYLLLPFRLSFLARYQSIQYFDGIIGPFFILTLPLLCFVRRIRVEARYLLAFAVLFYLFWMASSQQVRYLLPALPPLALALAFVDDQLSAKRANAAPLTTGKLTLIHRLLLALVMICFAVNFGVICYYFNEFNYGPLFTGQLSAREFLRKKFFYYETYEYINSQTPPESRIFLIVTSNQPYYLDREHFGDAVFEDFTIKKIVENSATPAEILTKLKALGITHLLYRPYLLFDVRTTPFVRQADMDRFVQFLQLYCRGEKLDGENLIELYAIKK